MKQPMKKSRNLKSTFSLAWLTNMRVSSRVIGSRIHIRACASVKPSSSDFSRLEISLIASRKHVNSHKNDGNASSIDCQKYRQTSILDYDDTEQSSDSPEPSLPPSFNPGTFRPECDDYHETSSGCFRIDAFTDALLEAIFS